MTSTDTEVLNTKLGEAASQGNLIAVERLVKQGANIHANNGWALNLAATLGHSEVVKFLLDRGADVHPVGDRALRNAAARGHAEVVGLLLEYGADVHAGADDALGRAAINGHSDVVRVLLEHGANIHASGDRPLYYAAAHGHVGVVKLLLAFGADIHARDDAALDVAAHNGHLELLRLLLDRGAYIDAGEDAALVSAAKCGHVEAVKLLLERGADIHAGADQALFKAVDAGQTAMVALLLDRGADIHADNDRPLQLAEREGRTEVIRLLESEARLKSLAASLPRTYVYSAAAIANRLELDGEALIAFVEDAAKATQDRQPKDTLGLRPYLEVQGLADMAVETAEGVLLPQLLLDAGLADKKSLAAIPQEKLDRWIARLRPLAGRLLLHGHDLPAMLALGKSWHVPGNALPDQLRSLRGGEWQAVLPDIKTPIRLGVDEGEALIEVPITIKALTSQAELTNEGLALRHCVGSSGFGTRCRQSDIHILSFRAGNRPLATMEATVTGDPAAPLALKQLHGRGNGAPPSEAKAAWQWLQDQFKSGALSLNREPKTGWGEITMEHPPAPVVKTIGYWPSEERIARCYEHLAERLKIKQPTATEVRKERGFWTPRAARHAYRWQRGLMPLPDGISGARKDSVSGLHPVIAAAGVEAEWKALVQEVRSQSMQTSSAQR
jgi:ankyrin repeat protein